MRIEELKEDIWKCNHCSMCSEMVCDEAGYYKVCPVYQVKEFENYTARGHNTIALYLLEGSLKYDENIANILFKCTTCMICEEVCKPMGNAVAGLGGYGLKSILNDAIKPLNIDMNPIPSVDILETMRADCVDRGLEPEGIKKVARAVEKTGNIYGEPEDARGAWAGGITPDTGANTMVFAGDAAAYKAPEVAVAAMKILQRSGMRVDIFKEECASGALQFRTGYVDLAKKMVEKNLSGLKAKGIKELIVLSADDYFAIAKDWPRFAGELPFRVRHISMVISDLIKQKKLVPSKRVNRIVTYQDPCRLGRGMNIYEDPRIILRAIPGLELREMYPTAHAAWCFGGCGGVPQSDHELSMELGRRKLPLIEKTGAGVIATACPDVRVHMDEVIRNAGSQYRSMDIMELLAESLEV
ncbi:MAG: (Fe-S)-binding protein [Thermodesulfobacteriota bacterium]|nr:(Fe-S)-binding protein [Thermodesulfobacteriota bacterium]